MWILVNLVTSVVGSFIGIGIWQHFHFDDFFAERKERLEAKRARKRYARAAEDERRRKENWRPQTSRDYQGDLVIEDGPPRPPPDKLERRSWWYS